MDRYSDSPRLESTMYQIRMVNILIGLPISFDELVFACSWEPSDADELNSLPGVTVEQVRLRLILATVLNIFKFFGFSGLHILGMTTKAAEQLIEVVGQARYISTMLPPTTSVSNETVDMAERTIRLYIQANQTDKVCIFSRTVAFEVDDRCDH